MPERPAAAPSAAEEMTTSNAWRTRLKAAAGYWLLLLCALFIVSAFLAPQSFAVLAAAGGLAMLGFVAPSRTRAAGFLLLSLLCAWAAGPQLAAITSAKSVTSYDQLERLTSLKLVLMSVLFPALCLGAMCLPKAAQDRLSAMIAWGMAWVAGLIVIDAALQGAVFNAIATAAGSPPRPDLAPVKAAQGAYPIAVLIAPVSLWIWRRGPRSAVGVLAAAPAAACLGLGADAPFAAALAAGAVFVAMTLRPGLSLKLLAAFGSLYFLAAPWLVRLVPASGEGSALPASWAHRERIWRFVSDRILERPLLGHGLDASRGYGDQVPLHPHNSALQIWLELGLPGATLMVALCVWLVWRIGAVTDPLWRAAAGASLTAYAVIGALSFGVWQEWWLGLAAFAALFIVTGAPARAIPSS
ncbi:O-antigen ligase family protein [Caulobacter segnis]|uniref:O-antigen ligase family protein n=1 Tax=Caulobacter segnis TaxID=88688 RepID=UPI0024102DA0|nr:O-antigen ligase family protein [Caulobacter segnis]MDG2520405.1 O-antigen ligase family protein [Caulobacter segnis]